MDHPATKTLRGISVALIILAIISALLSVGGIVTCYVVGGIIDENSESIGNSIDEVLDSSNLDQFMSENVTVDNPEALATFMNDLRNSDSENLEALAVCLEPLTNGDYSSISEFLNGDSAKFGELLGAIGNLDDEDLIEFSAMTGTEYSELVELRDLCQSIDEEELATVAQAMDGNVSNGVVLAGELTMALLIAVFVFMLITCVISLVTAIVTRRNAANPEKLRGAFAWNIVAAVLCFLCGRIPSLVLHIVNSVKANELRKAQRQQPLNGGPVPPQGSPVQPTQPVQ